MEKIGLGCMRAGCQVVSGEMSISWRGPNVFIQSYSKATWSSGSGGWCSCHLRFMTAGWAGGACVGWFGLPFSYWALNSRLLFIISNKYYYIFIIYLIKGKNVNITLFYINL
jgi:hypothetical protein